MLNVGVFGVILRMLLCERLLCVGIMINCILICVFLDWNFVSFRYGYRKNMMGFVVSKYGIDESLVKIIVV